ncbi:MAG TPA: hypothetical protein VNW51_06215 [Mucilaginibacter sp.]|jgi:hypothetical protein|nr:hypothetical protein [Mucilaginibacter sp.]
MTIAAIREKLHEYINIADDKKIQAMYTMLERDIVEKYDLWEDEEFLTEINDRIQKYESGSVVCSTWDEVKLKARSR